MKPEELYFAWVFPLLCLFSLSACVTVATRDLETVGRATRELVFPPPPDDPRFVFERAIRGSTDVSPESEQSAMKRILTGTSDERAEGLAKPLTFRTYCRAAAWISASVTGGSKL